MTTASEVDIEQVKRDNFVHREIVLALSEERNAYSWEDAPAELKGPAKP